MRMCGSFSNKDYAMRTFIEGPEKLNDSELEAIV